jgi:hypothetical protein
MLVETLNESEKKRSWHYSGMLVAGLRKTTTTPAKMFGVQAAIQTWHFSKFGFVIARVKLLSESKRCL